LRRAVFVSGRKISGISAARLIRATWADALDFIETRRHWFTGSVSHDTQGSVNVFNFVEEEAGADGPQLKYLERNQRWQSRAPMTGW
jgi:hypothetical protein